MKRGPYFKYLKDPNVPIPYTTERSQRNRQLNELQPQQDDAQLPMKEGDDAAVGEQHNPAEDMIEMLHDGEHVEQEGEPQFIQREVNDSSDNESFERIDNEVSEEERAHEHLLNELDVENHDDVIENAEHDDGLMEEINVLDNCARNQERRPLYPNCPLTEDESNILIMSFLIRHGLTDAALEDLLELIDCHLPIRSRVPSKYLFLKKFPSIVTVKEHFYCPQCYILLNFEEPHVTCESCGKMFHQITLRRNGHFFIHVPLKQQLVKLLSGPLFYKLRRDCAEDGVLSDITSGQAYRTLRHKELISNNDISIQWNADGVQTFKSSKVSMCPIRVAINELSYRNRKENVLLAGLWCAAEKPILDLFLRPFVDELKDLHENGLVCLPPNVEQPITVKVHTVVAPVDSVARCSLQNIHQFNGECGCSYCLNPGKHVKVGNGFARVYLGGEGRKRTKEQHSKDAIEAATTKTVVNGVKGVSLLMHLPIFNIIWSFPPEYMHAVLLGVVKLFLTSWFDAKNYAQPWYLGTQKNIFNAKLLQILPPREVTRTPRSISTVALWKASEFKNFLLYYSMACLKNLLPAVHYKHWSLLVFSIYKFNSAKITQQDFAEAERAICKFVHDTEVLYGEQFMKFNVHLLLHIPISVKYFGALWAWSAFYFESYNYVLRNMLHSSQAVLQQICKSYLRYQTIKFDTTFNVENCSGQGRNLYLNMIGNYKSRTGVRLAEDNRLIIFGNGKNVNLDLVQRLSIQTLIDENIEDNAVCYERFIFDNILYHSSTYEKISKRNNSIVKTTFDTIMSITGIIIVFVRRSNTKKFIVTGKGFEILDDILCAHDGVLSSSYLYVTRETGNFKTCLPENLSAKCVILPANEELKNYVIPIVNTKETD